MIIGILKFKRRMKAQNLSRHFRIAMPARPMQRRMSAVTFHRPAVWPDAITLPAEPANPLRQLRQGAYQAIQAVLGQERMHEPPKTITQYRPHVSVAYINAPGPAQPIVSALQDVTPGPVTTALGSASVLTFHRDNRMYEWTAATYLPIGQDSQRAATH